MSIRENETLLWINYGPIYYVSLLFGALPFKYHWNTAQDGSTDFQPYKWGLLCSYLLFALNLYTGFDILSTTVSAFLKYGSCFDEICGINICRNVCAHITILWMHYVANSVSIFSILYLRRGSTLACLNAAHALLRERRLRFSAASWSVLFFLLVNWSAFFFHWRTSKFAFAYITSYLPIFMMQSLPIVTENMISTLLLVTEHSFAEINDRILRLTDARLFLGIALRAKGDKKGAKSEAAEVAAAVRHLKEYYWKCADLADGISDCFGLDFLVVGFCSTIRLIYFLFQTLKYAAEKSLVNQDGGFVLPRREAVVFSVAVVGKFCYLCYRCDCVVSEAEKIVPNLFTWRNRLRFLLDKSNKEQIIPSSDDERIRSLIEIQSFGVLPIKSDSFLASWHLYENNFAFFSKLPMLENVDEFLNLIKCRVISFHACSFFMLNLHLICSVFGLTITYFIVLMQFQASHST